MRVFFFCCGCRIGLFLVFYFVLWVFVIIRFVLMCVFIFDVLGIKCIGFFLGLDLCCL